MAQRDLKTNIKITGEDDYEKALNKINSSLRKYNAALSELKSKNQEAQNSYDYLKQKGELLSNKLADQKKKTEELRKAVNSANETYGEFRKKTEEAQKAAAEQAKKVEELGKTVGESSDEYKEAAAELEKYNSKAKDAEDAQKRCGEVVDDWKNKLNTAEAQQLRTSTAIQKNNQYLKEAEKSSDRCATSIDQFGKTYRQASKDVEDSNASLEKTDEAMEALTNTVIESGIEKSFTAVKEAITQCIEAAEEYESSIAKLQTISGADSIGTLSEDILELSSATGIAASDLANTAYNAISAGTAVSDAVGMAESASKLAIAGFTDTDSALSVLTTAINAYGESAGTATEISDSLIQVQNLGVTTVADLAANMGKAIATASAYGVNLSNLEAAYISTTKAGINTAESTTYLSSMFKELGDDGTEVSGIIQEKTGKSFGQLMSSGESLGNVLQILMDSVNGDSEALMNLWGSAEAAKGANAILTQGVQTFNSNLQTVQTSAGATESAYETMADTAEMAGQRATNAFNNLKVAVGEELSPALTEAKSGFADLTEWATELVKECPEIVDLIGAIVVGLGSASVAIISLNVATKVFIPTVQKLLTTLTTGNSIGLIVTIVASLASALIYLASTAEEADGALKDYGDAADSAKAATDGLNESFGNAQQTFSDTSNEIAATRDQASSLIDRLEALSSKTNKSNSDIGEMSKLVTQLNTLYPELGLELNETTGELSKTNDELERFITNANDSAMATAYEEKLAEESEAVVEAQKNLLAAKDSAAKADEEYAALQEEYSAVLKNQEDAVNAENEAYKNYTATLNKTGASVEEIDEAYSKYLEAQSESAAATQELDDWQQKNIDTLNGCDEAQEDVNEKIKEGEELLEEAQQTVDETTEAYNDYQFRLTEVGDACQDTFDKTIEMLDGMDQSSEVYERMKEDLQSLTEEHVNYQEQTQASVDSLTEKLNELKATYDEQTESIKGNLESQVGGLEAANLEIEYSAAQIAENLKSQVEYLQSYEQNVQAITSDTSLQMTDTFLAFLQSGTQEAVQVAAAMNQAISEGNSGTANEIIQYYSQVQSQLDATSQGMANSVTGYSEKAAELQSGIDTCIAGMNRENDAYNSSLKTMQGAIRGIKSGADPYKTLFNTTGKLAVKGLDQKAAAQGFGANNMLGAIQGARALVPSYVAVYRNAAAQAQAAMRSVDKQASPSKVYRQFGRFNIEGAILGVKSMSGEYVSAYTSMAKEAMDAYNSEMESLAPVALEASQSLLNSTGGLDVNIKDSTSELISDVGSSLASNNKSMGTKLDAVVSLLKKYLPEAGNTYLDGDLVTKKVTTRQNATSKFKSVITGAK
jgi:TP901 family phage tail tape measure protein